MADFPSYPVKVDIMIPSGGNGQMEAIIRAHSTEGHIVFELRMDFQEFARAALTSSAHRSGMLSVIAPELLGSETERKEIPVTWERVYDGEGASKAVALAPYEVDGWRGQEADLGNNHRSVKGTQHAYRVSFTRTMLDGHPVTGVHHIGRVVQAAQMALAVLDASPEKIGPSQRHRQARDIDYARDLLRVGLKGGQ